MSLERHGSSFTAERNTEERLICNSHHVVTDPPLHPLQLSLPVASLSAGRRQKGHEPGCGFSKLAHSLYHQGPVCLCRGLICFGLFGNNVLILTLAVKHWPQGELLQRKPFWRWLLLWGNVCCVLSARFQQESGKSFLKLFGPQTKKTYQWCVGIWNITALHSSRQN